MFSFLAEGANQTISGAGKVVGVGLGGIVGAAAGAGTLVRTGDPSMAKSAASEVYQGTYGATEYVADTAGNTLIHNRVMKKVAKVGDRITFTDGFVKQKAEAGDLLVLRTPVIISVPGAIGAGPPHYWMALRTDQGWHRYHFTNGGGAAGCDDDAVGWGTASSDPCRPGVVRGDVVEWVVDLHLSKDKVEQDVEYLFAHGFGREDYVLLSNNCHSFKEALVARLGGRPFFG